MSARKWPFYTLEIGKAFVAEKPPRCLKTTVYRYGTAAGKKFSIERLDKSRTDTDLRITRVA
jgi:hypothetical protein